MMQPANYPYASGDLLEVRNNYSYSSFQGRAFLDSWRLQRTGCVATLLFDSTEAQSPARTSPTRQLLTNLLKSLQCGSFSQEDARLLDTLIQRFEVTKRLHGEYNAAFRPTDLKDYKSLEEYVCLAEVLEASYAMHGGLPRLNALLKCLDTLTALAGQLNAGQAARLATLVDREHMHVEALEDKIMKGRHA